MAYLLRNSLRNQRKTLMYLIRNDSTSSSAQTTTTQEVPGLSPRVVNVPSQEVGPGASKNATYKNPEYFCYNNVSYFEAEVEMLKFRLPQPSNKKK